MTRDEVERFHAELYERRVVPCWVHAENRSRVSMIYPKGKWRASPSGVRWLLYVVLALPLVVSVLYTMKWFRFEEHAQQIRREMIERARLAARQRRKEERLTREQASVLCDSLISIRNKDRDPSWVCTICLEGQPLVRSCSTLPCGHEFHRRCLRRWLRRGRAACPLCKYCVKSMGRSLFPIENNEISEH